MPDVEAGVVVVVAAGVEVVEVVVAVFVTGAVSFATFVSANVSVGALLIAALFVFSPVVPDVSLSAIVRFLTLRCRYRCSRLSFP